MPDAPGKLGLNEAKGIGRSANIAPLDAGRFVMAFGVPLGEAAAEFVADGLVVGRNDNYVRFLRSSVQEA